ncbi:MAG TPA: hypothetical protein VFJ09_15395 [Nocardioidaceae bacterium]|nr:hypothetical protein [Nocardioidaceae bacterium]
MLDLSFTQVTRFRPFQVVADAFVQATDRPRPHTGLTLSEAGPPAPFAAVEVETGGCDSVRAGLATSEGDFVGLVLHGDRLALEVRRTGRASTVKHATVDRPSRLAFALCENRITALTDHGSGWRPMLTARPRKGPDLRRPETLAGYRYAWGTDPGSDTAGTLGAVRAGPFGMTGLRDPHLVTQADGRPYERDGRLYLTWTCAGLGGFRQAHWGVFALDPHDPTSLEQTAQLYTARDGLLLGDHAGHLVRDDDRWIVLTSAWGDFRPGSVHARCTETTDDLLTGVHLLRTQPLELPTRHAAWDPGLARIDGRWHVSFVESASQRPFRFHPALASGPPEHTPWREGLQLRGAAGHLTQCEGPILTRRGEDWWLLASDGDGRGYPVFDLDLHERGRLHAPYPTNIPHPQTIPLEDGSHLLVTFDGTGYAEQTMGYGGHGDVLVMRSR